MEMSELFQKKFSFFHSLFHYAADTYEIRLNSTYFYAFKENFGNKNSLKNKIKIILMGKILIFSYFVSKWKKIHKIFCMTFL